MYPSLVNTSDTKAHFVDLQLTIYNDNDIISTNIYDKEDDVDESVNFPIFIAKFKSNQ